MNHPAIAITGLGVFSAAGSSVSEMWESVAHGRCPAVWREINLGARTARIPVCAAGEPGDHLNQGPWMRRMDRSVRMAHAAATQAWEDAGLNDRAIEPTRLGAIVGTSRGPVETVTRTAEEARKRRVRPTESLAGTIACLSGTLSVEFGIRGPAFTVSASCASGGHAIALAAQQIALGSADAVLVGGAEAPVTDAVLAQFQSARILGTDEDPKRACRPFDVTRNGTVLGEGAGFLVLESLDSAKRRGARVHASLAGWAIGSEGSSRTGDEESGEALCRIMRGALASAGWAPEAIGYVNLHGTGTQLNDRVERRAMRSVFGGATAAIPCSSTKPVTGHCMGAASAIEAVISVLALGHGLLPPTVNCREREPGCPLDLIVGQPRELAVDSVMSNSIGFWGTQASLVFTRADAPADR